MDANKTECIICKYPNAKCVKYVGSTYLYECPICGEFEIDQRTLRLAQGKSIDPKDITMLSWITRYYSIYFDEQKIITWEYIKVLNAKGDDKIQIPKTIEEKIYYILKYLRHKSKYPGDEVNINPQIDYPIGFTSGEKEFNYYMSHLTELNYIHGNYPDLILTVNGWKYLSDLEKVNLDSNTCFVAMCFKNEYDNLYKDAIYPAIKKAKYKPIRLKEENEEKPDSDTKIDDRIIAEIKKARFVVADFSEQKQNVYYEAGFAKGLGIKVIHCCKQDELDKNELHFDTRNYLHLPWEEDEYNDFEDRLYNHIIAEIGEGRYIETESN
jgi:hypothetical protein